jgi:hypothetical protein
VLSSLPETYSESDEGQGHGGGIGTKLSRRGGSVTVERSELSVSRKAYTERSSDEDGRVYSASNFMPAKDFEKTKEREQLGFKGIHSMPSHCGNFDEEKDDVSNMSGARRTWDTYSALTDSQPLPHNTGWIRPETVGSAARRSSCTALDSEIDDDACDTDTPPPPTRRTWPAAPVQPLKDLNWSTLEPKVKGISMYSLLHFDSSPREESDDTSDAGDGKVGISAITKMPPRIRKVEKEICKRRR